MEFQLLKTAASDVYQLPRVGAFSDLLDTEIAEMYTENEPHRPELAATARFLAEHFRIMDPDTKLFTSMSSTDPADLINKKLLKFTADDVSSLMAELTDSSIEITKDVAKKLLGIVISEAIGIAYSLELRTNPDVLLGSKVRRSVDGPIIRTAADEDVSNEHTGRGRKQLHIPWRASEQKAPSARDIRDIYAMLAYNSAFNAFVTTSVVGASNAKNDLLSQLALNFETTQYFDAILGSIKKSLANGSKIRLGDGTPLTPNPSIGAFFGADHKKFFATSKSDIPSSKPSSILQIISHGSSMDKHATFLPYASLSRKSLYGEQLVLAEDKGKEDASTAYTGIAARASVKALASKYSSNAAKMSEDLSAVLLRGFNTHLSMLRANGIPFNKYKTLIPGLTDATTENLIRQALIDIVASLPKEFESLSSAKAVCRQAIEKQHTKLAEKGLANKEVPAAVEKQYNGLIDFAAQIVLRLPVNITTAIQSFDPREMLRPVPAMSKIPASQASFAKEILGSSDAKFDDVFAVIVASTPSGGAAAYTYNQLMSSDNTKDFFILSARQKTEKNEKRAGVIFAKLKYLMVQLQKNIISFSSGGPRRAFDEKSPAGRQSASLARLLIETINKSEDGEIQILEMLLSGCLQSIGVSKKVNARALAGALAANTVDSPVVKQLVDEVAAQLPPKWNSADDSRVESDYNNINTYIDPWKGAPELYADPAHPFNKTKAALYMMHEGSFHTALHTMMSNGMVARYDQNRDEHVAYVEKTYSLPEIDDEVDVARVLDIDTKIAEMQSDKVLDKFLPLDAADVQKRRFAPREKPSDQEVARKRNVGLKFQDFFNRWSKSTIVAKLYTIPRTPTAQDPRNTYGADYFDALSVLVGRRFYELFDNYVDNKLELKNIGARAGQVLDEVHRQGAEALRDAAREQGEDDASGKGDGDEFSGRYTSFAREWALQPRFSKSTGGFDTQSLAGFVSECLVKKDIANRGGAEGEIARQFVDRLVMPLDAKRFKVSKDANPPILGLVMNRAVWAYGKITQTKNVTGLQRMLSDNIALNKTDLPMSPIQVLARVGAFVDPIVSAKSLAKGSPVDSRAKAMNRAMVRTSSEFDNYEDWELDMIAYMRSYRAEVENEISNSAASADLKAMMRAIVADSAGSTSGRWAISEEQKQALTLFGQSLAQAGDIKYEVLWKQTFQYAMGDVVKQVSAFLDSSGQKNTDKVMAALVASRPIKLLWNENIKDLLGPGGLVEKTDEEKYALSVVALVSVLAEDSTLVTNLVAAPQVLEERAAEVMKEAKSAYGDAEDADFASDVDESGFGGQVDFKAHIDAMASKSSKMQTLVAAVFATAPPDFEEILSGSDYSVDEKLAAIEKNISLPKLVSKESGQKYLRSAYSAQIGAFADGNAPASLQAQVNKAEDLRPKELLEKMPIVAPDIHKLVIADIERMLASIKIEVNSKAVSLESVVAESEKARTQMQIQKETAHMADLQRMVFAGRELASSQAPELPVAARYKLAIQEFANYNGKRIEEWDRKLRSQQLRPLTSLDDKLRSQNSSLDKAGEDTIRATFGKDQELIALAMDPVVKQLFAVRTSVIAKVKMVNDLKGKLAQIDDTELNAFHDAMREKEKEFTAQNASDLGYRQITEDRTEITDEDVLEFIDDADIPDAEDEDAVLVDEELSSVPDADGKMLSNKELDSRVAEKNKLKKSIVSVKAELARPTMRMEYGSLGRKTLEIFESAVAADSFVSKNSREHMIEMNDVLGSMTKYLLKGIGTSVVTEDEEAEILHTMQGFVNRFGSVLDRPIEPTKKKVDVSVSPEPVQSPSLEPVGTQYDQQLSAEVDATAVVIKEALKTEKSPSKISNLKNLLLFVSAFEVSNRAFKPGANPKEAIALMEMIAKDVAYGRINQSNAENLTMKMEITQRSRGLTLKTTPNFVDMVEEVAQAPAEESSSAPNTSILEAMDLIEKQSRVFSQLAKTFLALNKGNPSVTKLSEKVGSAGEWLAYIAETLSIVNDKNGFAGFSANDVAIIRKIDGGAGDIIDVLEVATESPEAAAALSGDQAENNKITELVSLMAKIGNHLSQVARQASAKNDKVIRTGDGWLLG